MSGFNGFPDEFKEPAIGVARDDIKRDQSFLVGSHEVFLVSIEDTQIVFRSIIRGIGNLEKAQ